MAWKSMGIYAVLGQNSVWLLARRVGLIAYCKLHCFLGSGFNMQLIYIEAVNILQEYSDQHT